MSAVFSTILCQSFFTVNATRLKNLKGKNKKCFLYMIKPQMNTGKNSTLLGSSSKKI